MLRSFVDVALTGVFLIGLLAQDCTCVPVQAEMNPQSLSSKEQRGSHNPLGHEKNNKQYQVDSWGGLRKEHHVTGDARAPLVARPRMKVNTSANARDAAGDVSSPKMAPAQFYVSQLQYTASRSSSEKVTCQFTIDNVVESVNYDGQALHVKGEKSNWKAVKSITFTLKPAAYLVFCGHDLDDKPCESGGFSIHCDHHVPNDVASWEAVDGMGRVRGDGAGWKAPCTTKSGFYLTSHRSSPKMWATDAKKNACFRWQSCGKGYHRVGKVVCEENACACAHGSKPKKGHCKKNGAEQCSSCNDGYVLKGEVCESLSKRTSSTLLTIIVSSWLAYSAA